VNYFIGLNLSHDSSVAITDSNGRVIIALQEERYSRRKNEYSFPYKSIEAIMNSEVFKNLEICKGVIVGSHRNPDEQNFGYWHQIFNPQQFPGWPPGPGIFPPGTESQIGKNQFGSNSEYVKKSIISALPKFDLRGPVVFTAHHDAHSASGSVGSGFLEALSMSFDGSGDDESAVIQHYRANHTPIDFARISSMHSLGALYSSVTRRYSFKANRHEGKITGLAAFGSESPAFYLLRNFVEVKNGCPEIVISRSLLDRIKRRILKIQIEDPRWKPATLDLLIDILASRSSNYPDLAYAVQKIIEDVLVDTVEYWVQKSRLTDLTLSGGVFSNVRINQRIAELPSVGRVFIFPNMGDGGLALGGIWRVLSEKGEMSTNQLFKDMYLGLDNFQHRLSENDMKNFNVINYNNLEILAQDVAKLLVKEKIIGVFQGRMEFGPRALGNRSIIANPFRKEINIELNKRLNRTEFMPFAPIVMSEFAHEIFDFSKIKSLEPFNFMTMTCNVKNEWQNRISATVHVDNTARPQIVTESANPLIHGILNAFKISTGCPVLINTSFNAHEEPIIESIQSALNSLQNNMIDFLVTPSQVISRKN
jgi:carbamoyltransferase